MPSNKPVFEEVLSLPLHAALGMFGSMVISLIVFTPFSWLLTRAGVSVPELGRLGPYTPAFWGVAFLLGLLVNKFTVQRSACWVWIAGLLYLVTVMSWDISILKHSGGGYHWKYEFDQLFSIDSNKCGGSECLGGILVTTPVLNSIAYSLGARLAHRLRQASAGNGKNPEKAIPSSSS